MFTQDQVNEKWKPLIEDENLPKIEDPRIKSITARLLENQELEMNKNNGVSLDENNQAIVNENLNEAPVNLAPGSTGASVATWDPVLIAMLRRAAPVSIGFDIFGVQPMTAPTGLIFAMKSKYDTPTGDEALFNEADTTHSGSATAIGGGTPDATLDDPFDANYGTGEGMTTEAAELLGGTGDAFKEMAFEIVKESVTAQTRALKASWTVELQQDMQAVHGLSAENELANILSTEVTAEIDRELVRRAYIMSKAGAQTETAVAGQFDLDVDSNGRWSVERFKGLMYQIERDANAIALSTRRGKGNFIITSADVASALAMTGLLEANPTSVTPGYVNPASSSYVGVMNGSVKVFVDPFVGTNGYMIGYKGTNPFDAAAFYCPYIPYTLYKAVGESDFQPRMGVKTRAGFVINPYDATDRDGIEVANSNYLKKVQILNLL